MTGHRLCASRGRGTSLHQPPGPFGLRAASRRPRLGDARGLRFDRAAARHAIHFFGFLRHCKGEWAGQTFKLAPWQAFVVGCLFGWRRADGLRRFRTAYCAVPRKTARARCPPGSRSICSSPTASRVRRSTPPRPPATRRGSCSMRPADGRLVSCPPAPGRGADQQPERRGQRLALHAAVFRRQLHGWPERPWRDHRRAPCP